MHSLSNGVPFSNLRHPNVVLFMGACTTPGNLTIITELMSKYEHRAFLFIFFLCVRAMVGINPLACVSAGAL